jgi:hypothetical protein
VSICVVVNDEALVDGVLLCAAGPLTSVVVAYPSRLWTRSGDGRVTLTLDPPAMAPLRLELRDSELGPRRGCWLFDEVGTWLSHSPP